jgi:hypothetical protein
LRVQVPPLAPIALRNSALTTKRESSRGAHKRKAGIQPRMDLESTFKAPLPNTPTGRIKDNIITLFDDDFSLTIKAVKDWVYESADSLQIFFRRAVKQKEVQDRKLTFEDGIRHFRNILLTELLGDEGSSLEDTIMSDLSLTELISNYCAECNKKLDEATVLYVPFCEDCDLDKCTIELHKLVPYGKYTQNRLITLLRTNKNSPAVIQYVTDIMES